MSHNHSSKWQNLLQSNSRTDGKHEWKEGVLFSVGWQQRTDKHNENEPSEGKACDSVQCHVHTDKEDYTETFSVFSALCDGMCCMAPESHVRTVRIIQWTLF
jgi:hypothetical protein